MELLNYKQYKQLAEEQGRKPSWIAKQLDCSYSTVYKYFNGLKNMSLDKVQKLHHILIK